MEYMRCGFNCFTQLHSVARSAGPRHVGTTIIGPNTRGVTPLPSFAWKWRLLTGLVLTRVARTVHCQAVGIVALAGTGRVSRSSRLFVRVFEGLLEPGPLIALGHAEQQCVVPHICVNTRRSSEVSRASDWGGLHLLPPTVSHRVVTVWANSAGLRQVFLRGLAAFIGAIHDT